MKPSGLAPTLAATASDAPPGRPSQAAIESYQLGEVLGRGGMGEVVLAEDLRIGRSVAVKRLRADAPSEEAVARFLREARIQARLEHPAIVPVHELGRDAEGRPYFTMKRLAGVTLAAELATASRSKLLRAFVDVCLAIELAHSRRVVHRDLKPANIMLGDFGEVYVLDWGIAHLLDEPDESERGQVLGTPGYMAPEQARGEPIDPAADVYALGRILSEILRADAPPELAAACQAALAMDRTARPTARALADRVQQYLDGDRDLEQRRLVAGEELVAAHAALAANDRAEAMRAAGRALALDPRSSGAAQLVSSLMIEPPKQLPAELADHLAAVDTEFQRRQWDKVALAWGSAFLFVPAVVWLGVTKPVPMIVLGILLAAIVGFAWRWSRGGVPWTYLFMIAGAAVTMLLSRLFGTLILVPAVFAVQLLGFAAYPKLMRRPMLPIATLALAFVTLHALELAGVIERSWSIVGDTIVSRSNALVLVEPATSIVLVVAHLFLLVVTGAFGWWLSKARHDAQRQVEIQAWHLRKLLPS
jgi:serine/threonine-protein kinase